MNEELLTRKNNMFAFRETLRESSYHKVNHKRKNESARIATHQSLFRQKFQKPDQADAISNIDEEISHMVRRNGLKESKNGNNL